MERSGCGGRSREGLGVCVGKGAVFVWGGMCLGEVELNCEGVVLQVLRICLRNC